VLKDWLAKAGANLDLAERLVDESAPYCNAIAFHCQQSAAKHLSATVLDK